MNRDEKEQLDRIEAMVRWLMEVRGIVNVDDWLKDWHEDREFRRSQGKLEAPIEWTKFP